MAVAGLAPQPCLEDLSTRTLIQSTDALWKTQGKGLTGNQQRQELNPNLPDMPQSPFHSTLLPSQLWSSWNPTKALY